MKVKPIMLSLFFCFTLVLKTDRIAITKNKISTYHIKIAEPLLISKSSLGC